MATTTTRGVAARAGYGCPLCVCLGRVDFGRRAIYLVCRWTAALTTATLCCASIVQVRYVDTLSLQVGTLLRQGVSKEAIKEMLKAQKEQVCVAGCVCVCLCVTWELTLHFAVCCCRLQRKEQKKQEIEDRKQAKIAEREQREKERLEQKAEKERQRLEKLEGKSRAKLLQRYGGHVVHLSTWGESGDESGVHVCALLPSSHSRYRYRRDFAQ